MVTDETTKINAQKAEEKYGIPSDVYIELCTSFSNSKHFVNILDFNSHVKNKIATSFALGLIIGWLKSEGKDDMIEKIIANQKEQ